MVSLTAIVINVPVHLRTSFLSWTLSRSYPSNSSSSSGNLTTTEPPQPPTHDTRETSVQIQPRLAHSTSLIAVGLGDHRSTRRNVSSLSKKRSRSHGTKLGRVVDETEETLELARAFKIDLPAAAKSLSSLSLSRTFLMDRSAGRRSRAVVGVAGVFLAAGSGVDGLVRDSSTR
jgi:hypothetical protein